MSWIDHAFVLPGALWAIAALPAAWLAVAALDRARAGRLRAAVGPRAPALARERSPGRRAGRRWVTLAALLLALVAVAQPRWGAQHRAVEQRGVDLIVCLDVSRSMLARDLEPSRLAFARAELRALCRRSRGDRLGLIAFAGEARLTVPLTADLHTFAELAELTDPLSVERGGTDLGAALTTALDALERASGEHEAIVLITDGEDHEQRGLLAARACARRGIAVHCLGLGSPLGSKITVGDGGGEAFLRSRAGEEVVTALDHDGLAAIAAAAGGGLVTSATPQPLLELYERHILPMARKTQAREARVESGNRYQWPLLLALLLWLGELAWTERARR